MQDTVIIEPEVEDVEEAPEVNIDSSVEIDDLKKELLVKRKHQRIQPTVTRNNNFLQTYITYPSKASKKKAFDTLRDIGLVKNNAMNKVVEEDLLSVASDATIINTAPHFKMPYIIGNNY